MDDREFILSAFATAFSPRKAVPIDEWVERESVMLPANTSEPGRYSVLRTPYQREVLRAMSPQSPSQRNTLCFGAQLGKTTMEMAAMMYFICECPRPQLFVFSDEANLRNFIRNKFDPFLAANPSIRTLLGSEGRTSGDSLTGKQYPGGFIKYVSGKSESSLRGDSVCVVFLDELDAVGGNAGGDVVATATKRTNTWGDSRKVNASSTPLNGGVIRPMLEKSTFEKFFVPCPHCGEEMTFEMEHFDYTVEDSTVTDAWMECPHCSGLIYNEHKVTMLPQGVWRPTNPGANPLDRGFYLPTFYAPVGWVSWKALAQEWHEAQGNAERMKAFYNTVLAQEYTPGAGTNRWRPVFEKALQSPYRRGTVPSWVCVLTSATDVQHDRLETQLTGWGPRGRRIVIDAWVFPFTEDMDNLNDDGWVSYRDEVLRKVFVREDGAELRTWANAIDSGYRGDTVFNFHLSCEPSVQDRLYVIKGAARDDSWRRVAESVTGRGEGGALIEGGALHPVPKRSKRQGYAGCVWYEVPTFALKEKVFHDIAVEDNPEGTMPSVVFFPCDFGQEFYQQIFSEALETGKGRMRWRKVRDRNEQLDLCVYNLAMYHLMGFDSWDDATWEAYALMLTEEASKPSAPVRGRRVRRLL